MTNPAADPPPASVDKSLAALAIQVTALRGQVRLINTRLDQAGIHDAQTLDDVSKLCGTLSAGESAERVLPPELLTQLPAAPRPLPAALPELDGATVTELAAPPLATPARGRT
jgi:hypothetical protein